jgi:FKBP-type peptidyl-prolyl cis-trans isomerase
VLRNLLAAAALCVVVAAQDPAPASRPAQDVPMTTTESGLKYSVLVAGPEGARPKRGDNVKVKYRGTLANGTLFDESKEPIEFRLGKVIEGWNEGLKLMTPGSKYLFVIPGDLAYGAQGTPDGRIPPNAVLHFEVELLSFTPGDALPEPPKYVPLDEAQAKTLPSGLKYQVVAPGKGEKAAQTDTLSVQFSLFGPDKKLIWATEAAGGEPQKIPCAALTGNTGLPFMRAMLPEMLEGEVRRVECPAKEAFGERGGNGVPPGATTYWELKLVKIGRPQPLPEFVKPADLKLTTTASGLQYQIVKEGTGKSPTRADRVEVHYAGWLEDGTNFDASFTRGDTTSFGVTQVIAGWTEGLQLMKEGGAARFVIPGNLGYGARGFGQKIPPNATLVFYVELVKVLPAQ